MYYTPVALMGQIIHAQTRFEAAVLVRALATQHAVQTVGTDAERLEICIKAQQLAEALERDHITDDGDVGVPEAKHPWREWLSDAGYPVEFSPAIDSDRETSAPLTYGQRIRRCVQAFIRELDNGFRYIDVSHLKDRLTEFVHRIERFEPVVLEDWDDLSEAFGLRRTIKATIGDLTNAHALGTIDVPMKIFSTALAARILDIPTAAETREARAEKQRRDDELVRRREASSK